MAIVEKELYEHDFLASIEPRNPYAISPESNEMRELTLGLTRHREPFMDSEYYPDMDSDGKKFNVYLVSNDDPYADVARSLEGHVMAKVWDKTSEEIANSSDEIEGNSSFFIVLDVSDPKQPRAASSLSIADCTRGGSETASLFTSKFPDKQMPIELTVTDEDLENGLWDVMAVMSLKEYKGTKSATWAYSALYKASQLFGVHRWIASMSDSEYSKLTEGLGIPFSVIENTGKYAITKEDGTQINFGFHTINVDEIRPSMTKAIESLETAASVDKDTNFWRTVADMARIALNGSYTY